MKVVCAGGGPAGLYFAILLKLSNCRFDVTVRERNSPGRTQGWGVTYQNDLLDKLRKSDPESASAIRNNSVRWTNQVLDVRGRRTLDSGAGGYSIGRQRLLDILAGRAAELGVRLHFEAEVDGDSQLPEADLIVACDGARSRLRQRYVDKFKTHVTDGRNKYIWLGTTKVFDPFTFAMVESDAGWIWFYGYVFDSDTSTCIVECSPETWHALDFDKRESADAVGVLGKIFADALHGHRLMSGGSSWQHFRTVSNEKWHHQGVVLMGDAAHTTHFSIGSGTTLALEDAIALAARLHQRLDLEVALAGYERERRAALLQPQSEARFSALWFENVSRYIGSDDAQLFALLRERRSPLLSRIPPRLYYRLHQATESVSALGRLRKWIGPRARAAYRRWYS